MKADLYSAPAQTRGVAGLAHRTAAGFVVLTSTDGDDIIALIDDKQSESDLIDQIVAAVQSDGPESFSMLFTAGGDLYLIAAGAAQVSVTSSSSHTTLVPTAGQVLVHAVHAGINETAATITLVAANDATEAAAAHLVAGTTEASQLEIAIGDALLAAPPADEPQLADETPAQEVPATNEPQLADEPVVVETPVDETPAQESAVDETPAQEVPATNEPELAEELSQVEPDAAVEQAPIDPALVPVAATGVAALVEAEPVAIVDEAPQVAAAAEAASAESNQLETTATPDEGAPVGPVMVLGVACPQGHHNHPDAVYCSQCGTKMGVHHTTVLLNGPRPPLGVLVVDDGTTYSLSEDLVIGREPTSHKEVAAGRAQPMVLTDDTLSLSRKHAHIWLDDWSVFVQDLDSSNGSFLNRQGQDEPWLKLDPSMSTALEPGDRLRVGGRIIQVELHHVR